MYKRKTTILDDNPDPDNLDPNRAVERHDINTLQGTNIQHCSQIFDL